MTAKKQPRGGVSPDEALRKFKQILHRALLRTAIAEGKIDPKGRSPADLRLELATYLQRTFDEPVQLNFVIDHRDALLREARAYQRAGEVHLACLLLATWLEHWVNNLIALQAKKRDLTEDDAIQIVRDVSLRGKLSWVLKLLALRPLAKHHVAAITRVTDCRNAFVHYKWKGFDVDKDDPLRADQTRAIEGFDKTLRYLQRYETDQIHKRTSRKVQAATRHR